MNKKGLSVATSNKPVKTTSKKTAAAKLSPLSWLEDRIGWVLIAVGALGSFASLMLSVEEIHFFKHPAEKLACDINPVVGCGANMDTWQGHVLFGIPNQFLGLMVFSAVLTIGIAILAGATFRKWFWQGLAAGMLFGVLFVHWFIFESLAVIKHLCPYCMLTWIAVITGFWYTALYVMRTEKVPLSDKAKRVTAFAQRHHADVIVFWFLTIVALILWRFWYYWQTLI